MAYRLGQRFGDYRLIEYLGGGGFADVYLGKHIYLDKKAAVKVLKTVLTAEEIVAFRNEAQIITLLEHPHIIPIITFSVSEHEGQYIPFLVMAYAPLGSLDKRHPRGSKLSVVTIISYIKQIAEALQHAHNHKIIHRDIKPANFLLGNNEQVLLSDFGIALTAHRTVSWVKQNIVGSEAYMAPEQFSAEACPASDQYSLGVTVYQWLCGELPFTKGNMGYQHNFVPPPPLFQKVSISPDIEEVVLKALAKDPKYRFESAQSFAHALERASKPITIVRSFREVALAHQVGKDFMPLTSESQVAYALIEAKPTEKLDQLRMPLNFALVIDRSISMKGAKLQRVKEAMKLVIDRLNTTDYITLVTFDFTSQIIIPSTMANDPVGMKTLIDSINIPHASTTKRFMSKGMLNGLKELKRWSHLNASHRMILLTDNVTSGDELICLQLARDAAAAGIAIYPLGIGSDWDEDLLDTIGQLSGGMPAEFFRDPADALSIFQQQIQSAVDVAIRNATLTVRLSTSVTPKKAFKVLPIISDLGLSVLSDRQVLIPLGDLEKDKPQSVLIEMMIDPHPAGLFLIAQAELSYDVPITGLVGEKVRDDIKVAFTTDPNEASEVNPYVMNFAEKANAHRLVTRVLDEYK